VRRGADRPSDGIGRHADHWCDGGVVRPFGRGIAPTAAPSPTPPVAGIRGCLGRHLGDDHLLVGVVVGPDTRRCWASGDIGRAADEVIVLVVPGFGLGHERGSLDGVSPPAGVLEAEQPETHPGQARPQPPAVALGLESGPPKRQPDEREGPEESEDRDATDAIDVRRLYLRRFVWASPTVPHA
jgi:hypothetical protein